MALLTFTVGYTSATFFRLHNRQNIIPRVVVNDEALFVPVSPSCYPGRSIRADVRDTVSYFPTALAPRDWEDHLRRDWYAGHLSGMKEAPLFSTDDSLESYRFLWLRSFHHPVAVRIWNFGSQQFISVKETNGAGGYEPGRLIVNDSRKLAADEWSEFMRLLNDSCYWQLPVHDDDLSGTDGARWVLEAVKGGRYHVVDRWSPASGSYRELCLYLLKLSRLNFGKSSEAIY